MKPVFVIFLALAASSEAILPFLFGKKLGLLAAGALTAGARPRIYHERYYDEPYYSVRHYPVHHYPVHHYPVHHYPAVQTFRRADYAPVYSYTSNVQPIVSHSVATDYQPVGQPISVVETVQPSNRYPTYTHVDTQVAKSAATVYKVSVPVTYTNVVQGPTHHTLTHYSNSYVEPTVPRGRYVNGVWCEY